MNTRQKKVLGVLCAGVVILAWRVYALLGYLPASVQGDTTPVTGPANLEAPAAAVDESLLRRMEEQNTIAARSWGRDPFAPVGAVATSPANSEPVTVSAAPPPDAPEIVVSGISQVGSDRRAVVDGALVGVGDKIGERFTVADITLEYVTLESGGWRFRYAVGSNRPTQPVHAEVP